MSNENDLKLEPLPQQGIRRIIHYSSHYPALTLPKYLLHNLGIKHQTRPRDQVEIFTIPGHDDLFVVKKIPN